MHSNSGGILVPTCSRNSQYYASWNSREITCLLHIFCDLMMTHSHRHPLTTLKSPSKVDEKLSPSPLLFAPERLECLTFHLATRSHLDVLYTIVIFFKYRLWHAYTYYTKCHLYCCYSPNSIRPLHRFTNLYTKNISYQNLDSTVTLCFLQSYLFNMACLKNGKSLIIEVSHYRLSCLNINVWNIDNLQMHISMSIQIGIWQNHHLKKHNISSNV